MSLFIFLTERMAGLGRGKVYEEYYLPYEVRIGYNTKTTFPAASHTPPIH
jgi:hypothetical protein